MKKKFIAVVLCAATALSLAACGDTNTVDTQTTESKKVETIELTKRSGDFDIKPSELVTKLADYSDLELKIDSAYEVTDQAKLDFLTVLLENSGVDSYKKIEDRDVVKEDDYIKVNYTGYMDGEAFDNGSAENVMLDIKNNMTPGASGGYIEGFTTGLAGHKVGESVDVDVTFPESYPNNPDMAGKPATFKFEIIAIYSHDKVAFDDLDDAKVAEYFETNYGIKTLEDLKSQITVQLESQLSTQKTNVLKSQIIKGSEVDIPEDYLEVRVNEYLKQIENENCNDTMSLDDFFTNNGYTYDDAKAQIQTSLKTQIKMELVFGLIAEKEGVELKAEDYKEYIDYLLENSGDQYADENAIYNAIGLGDAEYGEKYLRSQFTINEVINKLVEGAKVSFISSATEESTEASTEQATEETTEK